MIVSLAPCMLRRTRGQLCCAFRGAETAWLYESGRDGHRRCGSDGRTAADAAGKKKI
ncbi:MAG: hypothetical protein ACLT0Y_00070 [Christensenellales bacterium]